MSESTDMEGLRNAVHAAKCELLDAALRCDEYHMDAQCIIDPAYSYAKAVEAFDHAHLRYLSARMRETPVYDEETRPLDEAEWERIIASEEATCMANS